MKDTTTTEFFKLIKHHAEQTLNRNGWRWSRTDSRLLDWCVWNMEATDGH